MRIGKISEKQAQILDFALSDEYALICDGAVRSGKTTMMAAAFLIWAMEHFDRACFAICGKTVQSAERNVVGPMQQLEDLPYTLSYKVSRNILTVRCGERENEFYLFGGKDESSYMLIQGMTLAGVLFDEVALMPRSFVDQAITRTISYPNAKLFFNCNPESRNHWFYREWIMGNKPRVKHLHFLLEDNPVLTAEQIEKAKAGWTGAFYRRYILGEWCAAEGLVYEFGEENITDTVPQGGEYYISVDYGTLNPFSAGLWCVLGDRAVRVKEYYWSGREKQVQCTDEEYCDAIDTLAGDCSIRRVVVDPSAASFIAALRKRGYTVIKANNEVLDGIRRTASYLKDGNIRIHRSCVHAIEEFGMYRWDEKATDDKVIKEHDHAMDDIRYFCSTIMRNKRKTERFDSLWAIGGAG